MSELPLCFGARQFREPGRFGAEGWMCTEGLGMRGRVHLGPYSRNMPRALWRPSRGGAVSHERSNPVPLARIQGGACFLCGKEGEVRTAALHTLLPRFYSRCRAISVLVRRSEPDSGPGFRVVDSGVAGSKDFSLGWGTARAEDAPGTPTQSHISPRILVYEDEVTLFVLC